MNNVLLFLGNTRFSSKLVTETWHFLYFFFVTDHEINFTALIFQQIHLWFYFVEPSLSVRVAINLAVQIHSWICNGYSNNSARVSPYKILKKFQRNIRIICMNLQQFSLKLLRNLGYRQWDYDVNGWRFGHQISWGRQMHAEEYVPGIVKAT
jgi:hypothetical protein